MKRRATYKTALPNVYIPFGDLSKENLASNVSTTTSTDYDGDYIYENGVLSKVLTPEGYIAGGNYHYFERDHLGNTRVVLKTCSTVQVAQVTDYYPFGMEISDPYRTQPTVSGTPNPYLYNGKEMDRMHGLNMLDYGARWYDAALGRWGTVDPLAEKYRRWSTYNYCMDNPVRFIDPDGRVVIDSETQKKYPRLTEWAKNLSTSYSNKPAEFKKTFKEFSKMSDKQINNLLKFGNGPSLKVKNLDTPKGEVNGITVTGEVNGKMINAGSDGKVPANGSGKGLIYLDNNVAERLENAKSTADTKAGTLLVESTFFHEGFHYASGLNQLSETSYDHQEKDKGKVGEIMLYGTDIGRTNVDQLSNPQKIPATIHLLNIP